MLDLVLGPLAILCFRQARIGTLAVRRKWLGRDRNQQVVAGTNRVAAQVIGGTNGCDCCVVFIGNLRDGFAVLDLVTLPAHAFLCRYLGECCGKLVGNVHWQDEIVWTLRVGRPAVVARVKRVHRVDIDAGEFGSQREIDLRADVGDDELRFIGDARQRHIELRRVANDFHERE